MSMRRILALAVVVAALAGTWAVAPAKEKSSDAYAAVERFVIVLTKVRDHYTEPVATEKLIDFGILGMVRGLDPELRRFTQADTERLLDHREKDAPDDTYRHMERFVKALTTLQKHDIEPHTFDMLADLAIRGMLSSADPHSSYLNQHESERLDAEHSRSLAGSGIAKSVPYAGVLSNGVGYIKLARFDSGSRKELDDAFAALEKHNATGLIVDLRSNLGGLLSAVAEVTEEFTPSGAKMFSTRGRDPSQNREFISSAEHPHVGQSLVILVNQPTVAGAEIVAGAIQDLDLGIVVGQATFGSGLVQTVIPLSKDVGGPKLKLTTARVYMPSGRCIQAERGSVAPGAAKPVVREFHTAMGRVVHDGEGIVPDLELPVGHVPEVMEDMDAYRIAIEGDQEVMTAAALIAEAPTLPQLMDLVAERNKAKVNPPLGAVGH